jgi:1-aminocyclopropane-1-carboxylate deaminase/D-cysteine desulfhydrase-like pyridoxal-dependent ACC family enzyme
LTIGYIGSLKRKTKCLPTAVLGHKCLEVQRKIRTYLLHGAVLLEKLTGLQLVKKFPAFYGTRRFSKSKH